MKAMKLPPRDGSYGTSPENSKSRERSEKAHEWVDVAIDIGLFLLF